MLLAENIFPLCCDSQVSMLAPAMKPEASKLILMNFPYFRMYDRQSFVSIIRSTQRWATRTYESGGVIVFDSFCISKGFEDWVRLQELLFEFSLREEKE